LWYRRSARVIDQHPAHLLRRDTEEMSAALPPHPLLVDQAQIGFVNQGGRF